MEAHADRTRALEAPATTPSDGPRFGELVGHAPAMREVVSMVQRIASSTASVLVTGESGTGKELIARAIHYNSTRAADKSAHANRCEAIGGAGRHHRG